MKTVFCIYLEGDVVLVENHNLHDPHAVAGLLKLFFRELSEPIATNDLRAEMYKITGRAIFDKNLQKEMIE